MRSILTIFAVCLAAAWFYDRAFVARGQWFGPAETLPEISIPSGELSPDILANFGDIEIPDYILLSF